MGSFKHFLFFWIPRSIYKWWHGWPAWLKEIWACRAFGALVAMAGSSLLIVTVVLLSPFLTSCRLGSITASSDQSPFPSGFLFGTASSSYQVRIYIYVSALILLISIFGPRAETNKSCGVLNFKQCWWTWKWFLSAWCFNLQYEGGYLADGKGLSNWDVFTHKSGNKYQII